MKKIARKILFSCLLILAVLMVDSQESKKTISFQVVDAVTNSPVELVHVINVNQHKEAISDLLGCFKIAVSIGDTLTLSSLGYYKQVIVNWGQFQNDSIYSTIILKPQSYELKELQFSWFATYEGFLKGFLQLNLPITKEEKDIARICSYFSRTVNRMNLMNLPQPSPGAGFGKDWLALQKELLAEKLEKERVQKVIEKKYSADIVRDLTGLKGEEVFLFMEFCDFKNNYILESSDYDIRLRIMDKFKVYIQNKATIDKR